MKPLASWLPALISDFLRAGTDDDTRAYSDALLGESIDVIGVMLERARKGPCPQHSAMTDAVNSPKGKAVEALVSHALRVCRIRDRERGEHAEEWSRLMPLFENELKQCAGDNFEFTTLAVSEIRQIGYLNLAWRGRMMRTLFSSQHPCNVACAVEGLAFVPSSPAIYSFLAESGVLDAALEFTFAAASEQLPRTDDPRRSLIQRLALAFLRGDEEIDSPRLERLFEKRRTEDLEEIAMTLYRCTEAKASSDEKDRVVRFWSRCVSWLRDSRGIDGAALLADLRRLACCLETVGSEEEELLLAVAPHVDETSLTLWFIPQLQRLAFANPLAICGVLKIALESDPPFHDFEDRLRRLFETLYEFPECRAKVKVMVNAVRALPGMPELFRELVSDRYELPNGPGPTEKA